MARSFKIDGGTNCTTRTGEMKAWKQAQSRRYRRMVRQNLSLGNWDNLPDPRRYTDVWDSPGDGSRLFNNISVPK